jgi:hypothetical protein
MESKLKITGASLKLQLTIGLFLTVIILALSLLYHFEVSIILLAAGGTLAGVGVIGTIGRTITLWRGWHLAKLDVEGRRQEVRLITYRADKAALEAEILAFPGSQRLITLPGRAVTLLDAPAVKLLPAGVTAPPPADFFQAMSDPHQAYAIVGAQRIGKSILAQHLAQHLTRRGVLCLVIGTKAQPGEWLGCRRYIGNERVPLALAGLLAEIQARTEASANTPRLAVFLDDWLNTVALDNGLAEAFFLEAATRILTAGIVPYFLLQSDSKMDWGTKHGAQLKNNFVHLLLSAPRENGRLNYHKLRGALVYPGEKESHPVSLPAGLPEMGESEPDFDLAAPGKPEPTPTERQIIALAQAGESFNEIARQVFGSAGGKQTNQIKDILSRFQ